MLEYCIMVKNLIIMPFNRFQRLPNRYKLVVFRPFAKLFLNLYLHHNFLIHIIIFHYVIQEINPLLYNSTIITIVLISSMYYVKIFKTKTIIH